MLFKKKLYSLQGYDIVQSHKFYIVWFSILPNMTWKFRTIIKIRSFSNKIMIKTVTADNGHNFFTGLRFIFINWNVHDLAFENKLEF